MNRHEREFVEARDRILERMNSYMEANGGFENVDWAEMTERFSGDIMELHQRQAVLWIRYIQSRMYPTVPHSFEGSVAWPMLLEGLHDERNDGDN